MTPKQRQRHIGQPMSAVATTRNRGRWYGNGREWETPPEFFAQLNREFAFTLDPCCTKETAKCASFFTEAEDGLSKDWGKHVVFMNPPYGKEITAWAKKAKEAARTGATVVGLLPASTDLAWWHEHVLVANAELRFIRGRLKFLVGKDRWASPFSPALLVVWRPT